MWWVSPLFKAIGQSQQKKPPRHQRSDQEQQVLTKLQNKERDGFNIANRRQQAINPALAIRDQQKSQTLGNAFDRGMENSIVTDELMRKIDRETQDKVIATSDNIAQQNQQYKDSAGNQVNQFMLNESQQKRQANEQRRQFSNEQSSNYANIAGDFMQGGLQSGFNFGEGIGQGGEKAFDFNNPPGDDKALGSWVARGLLHYDESDPEYMKLVMMKEAIK